MNKDTYSTQPYKIPIDHREALPVLFDIYQRQLKDTFKKEVTPEFTITLPKINCLDVSDRFRRRNQNNSRRSGRLSQASNRSSLNSGTPSGFYKNQNPYSGRRQTTAHGFGGSHWRSCHDLNSSSNSISLTEKSLYGRSSRSNSRSGTSRKSSNQSPAKSLLMSNNSRSNSRSSKRGSRSKFLPETNLNDSRNFVSSKNKDKKQDKLEKEKENNQKKLPKIPKIEINDRAFNRNRLPSRVAELSEPESSRPASSFYKFNEEFACGVEESES